MSRETTILIAVAVIALMVIVGFGVVWRQLRRRRLRRQFGPEYDRTVEDREDRHKAEQELISRERRHDELNIRPFAPATQEHYRREWLALQERFVDDPRGTVTEADHLVTLVIIERGYPAENYEQRLADLSVGHARTLDHYRQAHEIGDRAARDSVSTEDLRQAVVHYRILFDELLGTSEARSKRELMSRWAHSSTK